jgi:hypothetical protein
MYKYLQLLRGRFFVKYVFSTTKKMSRKKKSQLRQEYVLRSSRLRFYAILEVYSERRLQLYKKADLERKRRCRARFIKCAIEAAAAAEAQQIVSPEQQEKKEKAVSALTSFRCVFCRELTPAIHRLWWAVLCSMCYYNPFCIQTVVHETVSDIGKTQCVADTPPEKVIQYYKDLLNLENIHYHEIKTKQWNLNDGYKYYMQCNKFFRSQRIAEIHEAKRVAARAFAALRSLKTLSNSSGSSIDDGGE